MHIHTCVQMWVRLVLVQIAYLSQGAKLGMITFPWSWGGSRGPAGVAGMWQEKQWAFEEKPGI